ncbi:unnamed protein product [Protopolystoma xenopodis]|uniref:Uncharacterized protein n=1 Tax=Protopolystoma xenopodis TaxID=117903 RepID=A0A3S5A528_9PLAT|nr:unnamed protein product [Protopolystoma xenopodis]
MLSHYISESLSNDPIAKRLLFTSTCKNSEAQLATDEYEIEEDSGGLDDDDDDDDEFATGKIDNSEEYFYSLTSYSSPLRLLQLAGETSLPIGGFEVGQEVISSSIKLNNKITGSDSINPAHGGCHISFNPGIGSHYRELIDQEVASSRLHASTSILLHTIVDSNDALAPKDSDSTNSKAKVDLEFINLKAKAEEQTNQLNSSDWDYVDSLDIPDRLSSLASSDINAGRIASVTPLTHAIRTLLHHGINMTSTFSDLNDRLPSLTTVGCDQTAGTATVQDSRLLPVWSNSFSVVWKTITGTKQTDKHPDLGQS